MWNLNGKQQAANNQLLSLLSPTERAGLLPAAQCVSLSVGQVLDQSRELRDHTTFLQLLLFPGSTQREMVRSRKFPSWEMTGSSGSLCY